MNWGQVKRVPGDVSGDVIETQCEPPQKRGEILCYQLSSESTEIGLAGELSGNPSSDCNKHCREWKAHWLATREKFKSLIADWVQDGFKMGSDEEPSEMNNWPEVQDRDQTKFSTQWYNICSKRFLKDDECGSENQGENNGAKLFVPVVLRASEASQMWLKVQVPARDSMRNFNWPKMWKATRLRSSTAIKIWPAYSA